MAAKISVLQILYITHRHACEIFGLYNNWLILFAYTCTHLHTHKHMNRHKPASLILLNPFLLSWLCESFWMIWTACSTLLFPVSFRARDATSCIENTSRLIIFVIILNVYLSCSVMWIHMIDIESVCCWLKHASSGCNPVIGKYFSCWYLLVITATYIYMKILNDMELTKTNQALSQSFYNTGDVGT